MAIYNKIWTAITDLAQERVEIEQTGWVELFQIKNGIASLDHFKVEKFLKEQRDLGFTVEDIEIKAYLSTHNAWHTWISCMLKNKINGVSCSLDSVKFINRSQMPKDQLMEALAPEVRKIENNREVFLDNENAARDLIIADKFYQNNLNKMLFDQETHNFVLGIKLKMEQETREKRETQRELLRHWAIQNGSKLLNLRIEEGFNWNNLAHDEWFAAHTPEGWEAAGNYETDECWEYNNPTLEHIQALKDARKVVESPELMKCRHTDEWGNKTFYYFVAAKLKAPTEKTFQIVNLLDTEEISSEDDDE